ADGRSQVGFEALVSAVYPKMPTSLDLREVGRLKLTTEGAWRGPVFDLNVPPGWRPPTLPDQVRIWGAMGTPISVSTSDGRLEIGQATANIAKLILRDGQLKELALHTGLRGLRTRSGPSELVLNSDISLRAPDGDFSITGTVSGVESFTVSGTQQRLAF